MIISLFAGIALAAAVGLFVLRRNRRPTLLASRPSPGGALASVRRVFLYLVAAVGLVAACNGVVWLLQTMLRQLIPSLAAGPAVGLPEESTLALGLALTLAGLPTWWLAWRAVQARSLARSLDGLFMHLLWLVSLLFLALGSALAFSQWLASAYASLFAPVGSLNLAPWWNKGCAPRSPARSRGA
jgi:hypothetical protein